MWWCCASLATAPAGTTPCWRSLMRVAALAGGAFARRRSSCGRRTCSWPPACGMLPLRVADHCQVAAGVGSARNQLPAYKMLPLRAIAPCELAASDCPHLLQLGHGRPPSFLVAFAAKT
ncbi:hypothetical protein B296_00049030 [Ensete ventricosum]|uniref:Secreted protein n=1 Tax=Ensete ventricosum TaxID=4639 RepID=A0A426XWS4_ENSVE|nr:hypothetical protein B296_00049030 [Ensete ventricosum]